VLFLILILLLIVVLLLVRYVSDFTNNKAFLYFNSLSFAASGRLALRFKSYPQHKCALKNLKECVQYSLENVSATR
jgi:uncharacterized membrane protein